VTYLADQNISLQKCLDTSNQLVSKLEQRLIALGEQHQIHNSCSNTFCNWIVICLETAEEARREAETSKQRNPLNDNLLELLSSCESFELRVSILEKNCHENFRELFALCENTQQQQQADNPRLERRVATLLDTVKRFDETREKREDELETEIKKLKDQVETVYVSAENNPNYSYIHILVRIKELESDMRHLKGMVKVPPPDAAPAPAPVPETARNVDETREKSFNELETEITKMKKQHESEISKLKGRLELLSATMAPPAAFSTQPVPVPALATLQPATIPTMTPTLDLTHFISQPQPSVYLGAPLQAVSTQSSLPPSYFYNSSAQPPSVIPPPVVKPVLPGQTYVPPFLAGSSPPFHGNVIDIVPDHKYSLLVGRAGKTINAIREESGATVTIKEKTDKPPSKYYEVSYSGNCDSIAIAREMVSQVLNPNVGDSAVGSEKVLRIYKFGVQVKCHDPSLHICPCKFYQQKALKTKEAIHEIDDITSYEFGRLVVENVEKSLDLPTGSNIKAIIDKGSLVSLVLTACLNVSEITQLQKKYTLICRKIWTSMDSEEEFPELRDPTPVTNHTLYLTYVQTFSQVRSKDCKHELHRRGLGQYAPLFLLPTCY